MSEVRISAADVKQLRDQTGAGMMDCKKALVESDGDFEAAVDNLRKTGQKVSAKRADKDVSEGSVFADTTDDAQIGYLIALNCETDFVAKYQEFVDLGKGILASAVSNSVGTIEDLQAATMTDGRSISEHLTDFMGKIGEKIEITDYVVMKAETIVPYIHSNGKLAVMVALNGACGDPVIQIGKDVAMQIAAMNPVALDKGDIDQKIIDRELEVGKEQARAETANLTAMEAADDRSCRR